MTLIQVWGCLLIFVLCPLLGGIPASEWLTQRLVRRPPWRHGAKFLEMGIEASKGIASVCLAQYYFPRDPTWWIIALIALVCGQFWLKKSKQLMGIVAGGVIYSWQIAFLMLLIGGISITLLRERRIGRLGLLVLFPLLVGLYTQQSSQIMAAMGLSFVLAWVDEQVPQPPASPSMGSSSGELMTLDRANDAHLFGFFQRDRNIRTLDHPLNADQVGPLAATLSQLKANGYNIPPGWVLPPGDDAAPLIQLLNPSSSQPLMVRSSVIGVNPAGTPPEPIFQITSRRALAQVIRACRSAYSATPSSPHAQDQGVAVMVQVQVKGQYSGLAKSQDIQNSDPATVVIIGGPGPTPAEALMHPQTQQIRVSDPEKASSQALRAPQSIPPELVQKITAIAQDLETHYHGIPQQIEWSDDGSTLWILAVNAIQE